MFCAQSRPTNKRNREQEYIFTKKMHIYGEYHNQSHFNNFDVTVTAIGDRAIANTFPRQPKGGSSVRAKTRDESPSTCSHDK